MSVRRLGLLVSVITIVLGLSLSPRCFAATPQEVEKAIKKGVAFLYSQQNDEGSWDAVLKPGENGKFPGDVRQSGGPTGLAVYALLTAGESPKDPRILKAIDYLKKVPPEGTYAVGFRANAYALMPVTTEMKGLVARDANWIKNAMRFSKDVKQRGFYGYGAGPKTGLDRSTSQVAVLGAWGCAQAGNNLGDDYWKVVEDAWRKSQLESGAWNYFGDREASIAMTAAGVATLFVTQEYLHEADYNECRGGIPDPYIDKGLKNIGMNFESVFGYNFAYYALYSIERCGASSGYKFFGENNWFAKGADWLVQKQAESGSWSGVYNPDTSFALLFLARGRAPVAVNKLEYGLDDVGESTKGQIPTAALWNQRPRDVGNVSRWAGRQQERSLNFQIVNISQAPEEWHDAPILYISGNQPLSFSEEKVAKLKKFVEDGGLILGNADCSNKPFAESFRKLGSKMFPAYEFRVLPADHVLYTAEQFPAKGWKSQPSLLGLSNGSRELMLLYASGDPAKFWQMHMTGGHEEMHQSMADIFSYAIERESVRYKGETYLVTVDPAVTAERNMKLARLQYPGNWNPEAGGWRRMAAMLHNEQKIELAMEPVEIGKGKLDKSFAVAHLTGTAKITLSDAEKQELKKYVDEGGTLLVDACGGATDFAASIEPQLVELFGEGKPLPVLAMDAPLYAKDYMSHPKLTTVDYRGYARKTLGKLTEARVRGIDVKGRLAVLFSAEDLSTGMVGEPVDGIVGYSPQSATEIVQRVLIATAPKPVDANKPADAKPEEAKPEEAKPDEAKPTDKPSEEKKPEDKPAPAPDPARRRR